MTRHDFAARFRRFPGVRLAVLILAVLAAGCTDDPLTPVDGGGTRVGVVLNSVDVSLTVFPVEAPGEARATVGLGADGSPVGLSVRDDLAAVPMGFVPALAVVDLEAGTLFRSVALPAGSGATGSAFLNDSIVLVANPNLDSATPVNVLRGTTADAVPVGGFPQGVIVVGDRVVVLNAELGPDFLPTGPGTLTVLDRETLAVEGSVQLTGENPGAAVAAAGDRVWIVNSGSFQAGDGSLSLVDLSVPAEIGHWTGFGEFPGSIAMGSDGRLHVGSFGYGVAVWDPATQAFVRPPSNAVTPEGTPSVSGLGFDEDGWLYTLRPACSEPGAALRLDASWTVDATWPVGTCPVALAFTSTGG